MKRILILTIILSIIIAGFSNVNASAATSFDKDCIEIYTECDAGELSSNNPGVRSVYIEIKNSTSEAISGNLNFKIYDMEENEVCSLSKSVELQRKTTVTEVAELLLPYGVYTATAELSGSFGTIVKSSKLSWNRYNGEQNDETGVSSHVIYKWDNDKITSEKVHNAGFGWIRDDFPWKNVEKTKGVINITPEMDKYVNTIYESGNKLLLILGPGNPLYESGNFPLTDDGIAAYVRYCTYVVKHFKGKLSAVEIFNEPDLEAFTGIDIDGAQYTKLLKEAYTAIKKADPELTVVGGVICSLREQASRTFLAEMLEADAQNYMDVFSYHPYVYSGKYCDESSRINSSGIIEYDFAEQIQYAKEQFAAAGKPDMPLWLTEFGTTTHEGGMGSTYKQQAVNLIRAAAISKSFGSVDKLFIYTLKHTGTSLTEYEHNFGLLDYEYNEKPAYIALSAFNSMMANTNDNQVVRFSKPDNMVDSIQYNIDTPPQSGKLEISFSARYDKDAVVIGPEISDDLIGDGVLGVEAHNGKIVTNELGTVADEYILVDSYVPNQWYDFRIIMDFDSKTYDIEISSKGKLIKSIDGLDMISLWPETRDKKLTSAKYIGWRNWSAEGTGGAIDNLKITHTDAEEEVLIFDGFETYNTITGGTGDEDMVNCGYTRHKYSDVYAQPDNDGGATESVGYTSHRYSDIETGRTVFMLWTPENSQTMLSVKRDMADAADSHIISDADADAPVLHTSADTLIKYYDMYGNEIEFQEDTEQIVTDEPIYVVCAPRLKVEAVDGKIFASGSDAEPGALVTILAVNEAKPGRAIEYIRQVTADKNGAYKFELDAEVNKNYSVYVCVGDALEIIERSCGDLGVSIDYFVNNESYENIAQLKQGDKLRAVVSVENKNGVSENPTFYSCIYENNEILLFVDSAEIELTGAETATAETEIVIENEKEIGSISFYLWNKNIKPVFSSIKEEQNEK